MGQLGVEFMLVMLAVITAVGFLTTYIVAVRYNHVTAYLPYISETGRSRPESCIFTLICSIAAFFLFLIVYVRYKHIHHFYGNVCIKCWNIAALLLGFVAAFGLLVVGSFQDSAVPVVHFTGALMVFIGGVLYAWMQTIISYHIYHINLTRHGSSVAVCLRFFVSIFSTVTVLTAIVSGSISRAAVHPQEADHVFHLLSTWSEWLASCSLMLFFLTLHNDFMRIQVNTVVQLRVNEADGHVFV